tara:strand:- start:38 stop:454 length:417 start_codon:yes stop_codon:yes gene_type:complete
METKKLAIGTVVGSITMFVLGYLIFDIIMAGFYANNAAAAFGVGRDTTLWFQVALGIASLATLVTLCIGWSGANDAACGFKVGATVGFFVWLGVGLIDYGYNTVSTAIFPVVDASMEMIRTGIGGAVIASVLGKSKGA